MAETSEPQAPAAVSSSNPIVLGSVLALVGALLGAVLYAFFPAVVMENNEDILLVFPVIGALAGVGMAFLGKARGVAAGIIAAVLTVLAAIFAVDLVLAWTAASYGYGNVFSNLGEIFPDTFDYIKAILSAKPAYYAWVGAAAAIAFLLPVLKKNK